MAISNQTAIRKMIEELQQALNGTKSEERTREHIRAVRLLCDLILEEETGSSQAGSEQELQKMIGSLNASLPGETASTNSSADKEEKEDSIFDF